MGSCSYYLKAIDEFGSKTFLKLIFHHSNLESINELTESEMKEEIEEIEEYHA